MVKICPSLLSADFSNILKEIKKIEKTGVSMIHFDIMDGHFVPNLTFGPIFVKSLRKHTKLVFDVHLMVTDPYNYIEPFKKAGADILTFQIEANKNPKKIIKKIKNCEMKAGISLNPETPIDCIGNILKELDLVLIMTVHPGFAGQKFVHSTLNKIKKTRELINKTGKKINLEVDGGINPKTASLAVRAGADILVAGSSIFGSKNYKKNIKLLLLNRKL